MTAMLSFLPSYWKLKNENWSKPMLKTCCSKSFVALEEGTGREKSLKTTYIKVVFSSTLHNAGRGSKNEFPITVVWLTLVSLLVSQQPAHHWRKGSSAVKLKQSSARCARCATTPRSCPQRRTWIMWTRSWKPRGCRDNQRQAITSWRRGGGVLGSNPFPLTKTPETKCPFWKNVLTFRAKEVRDQHSTL